VSTNSWPFAQQRSLAGQKKVLGQLLGDGRAAHHLGRAALTGAQRLRFGASVVSPGFFEGFPLHAIVAHEDVVFRDDHGALEWI